MDVSSQVRGIRGLRRTPANAPNRGVQADLSRSAQAADLRNTVHISLQQSADVVPSCDIAVTPRI